MGMPMQGGMPGYGMTGYAQPPMQPMMGGAGDSGGSYTEKNRDPKLAVESISEVPGASKAHLDVVNGPVP